MNIIMPFKFEVEVIDGGYIYREYLRCPKGLRKSATEAVRGIMSMLYDKVRFTFIDDDIVRVSVWTTKPLLLVQQCVAEIVALDCVPYKETMEKLAKKVLS